MRSLELDVSFTPDYLTRHFGIAYGRDYFEDIRVRAETDRSAKRALHERFGNVGLGDPAPPPIVRLGYDDTLNLSLMFGGELQIGGGISWVRPGFLDPDAIDSLSCPEIERTWPHTQFLEQFEEAVRVYGRGSVMPPVPHGILEAALDMRGHAFLEDMLLAPKRAERLLDVLTETVIRMKEFWDVKCFGEVRPGLSLGGCSTTMLSPSVVASWLLPPYNRIASHFGSAFLCCCGVATQNLDNYARIAGARFIRVGWGTDLRLAAQRLRDHHVKASLDVVRAATMSADQLEKDTRHILESLAAVDQLSVLLIHASAETPDENIRRVAETVFDFAREHNLPMNDTGTCAASRRNAVQCDPP